MTKDEAMQHGLGYASGREDGSDVKTVDPQRQHMGWYRFAEAYAKGWEEFNDYNSPRFAMHNARDSYDTWQATKGKTIFKGEA